MQPVMEKYCHCCSLASYILLLWRFSYWWVT